MKLACAACKNFQQRGHNFCSVCGESLQDPVPEQPGMDTPPPIPDPGADDALRIWTEQGWTVQADAPCGACGNPHTCCRVEIREEEKGYNPGSTYSLNPLFLLLNWLLKSLLQQLFPPRIETMHLDRIVCPRCRCEHYENSRLVSERPVRS